MSKMILFATLVGVTAGVIGVAAYRKTVALQDELHAPKPVAEARAGTEALEAEVHRLEARIALLERRSASQPAAVANAPTSAPPRADPSGEADAREAGNSASARSERDKREQRRHLINSTIEGYWRGWGAKNGLTDQQTEALASMQVEAAKRKHDTEARMADHELTQADVKADNQAVTDGVRTQAQALLTPEQFAQFEADKGAEWGSSFRKIREASKAAATTP